MDSKLNDDVRIKIYLMILYVIRIDSIKELLDYIDDYVKGGNVNEEVDED